MSDSGSEDNFSEEERCRRFTDSAFQQAMHNDLRGTRHATTVQYNRAAERIVDMGQEYFDGPEVWEKLMGTLESVGIDCETFRARAANDPSAGVRRRKSTNQNIPRAKSTKSISSNHTAEHDEGDIDSQMTVETRSREVSIKRESSRPTTASYGSQRSDVRHTFVQYVNGDMYFCENCYRRLVYGHGDEAAAAYRCESCGYMCHKNCRNVLHISCVQPSTALDEDAGGDHENTEKMRRVADKIQALQKEIDIEMKIRDGLDKVLKARAASRSAGKNKKPSPQEVEIAAQVERSDTKLKMLQHELQKCRLQMAALASIAPVVAPSAVPSVDILSSPESPNPPSPASDPGQDAVRGAGSKPLVGTNLRPSVDRSREASVALPADTVFQLGNLHFTSSPASTATATQGGDGDVLKVLSYDPATKSESTRAFYLSKDGTVADLTQMALEKFVLPGAPDDYAMSYMTVGNSREEVPMRREDHPLCLNFDLAQTVFQLKPKAESARASMHAIGTSSEADKAEEKRIQKQKEVLMELCETEHDYATALKLVVNVFTRPLALAGGMSDADATEIFNNIRFIAELHEAIDAAIFKAREDPATMVMSVLMALDARVNDFGTLYTEYCANQHNQRRTLERVKTDPTLARVLAQCETTPKLNKLALADLLVKPLHRMTRYPILLKRMLSYTRTGTAEYAAMDALTSRIEEKVSDVNEAVHKREAAFRIHHIEETLDWNGVFPPFRIANDRRELVSEKPFTYIKKAGTAEVLVIVFTDLVLITRFKKDERFVLFRPPVPLEAAVFLDKPDAPGAKNLFQIVHFQHEIHSLQAVSAYDKNKWLHEAELLRTSFTAAHLIYEQSLVQTAAERYQFLDPSPSGESSTATSPGALRRRATATSATSGQSHSHSSSRDLTVLASSPAGAGSTGAHGGQNIKRNPSWTQVFKGACSAANPAQALVVGSMPNSETDASSMPPTPRVTSGVVGVWGAPELSIRRHGTLSSPKSSREELDKPNRAKSMEEKRSPDEATSPDSADTSSGASASSDSSASGGKTKPRKAFRFGFGTVRQMPESLSKAGGMGGSVREHSPKTSRPASPF